MSTLMHRWTRVLVLLSLPVMATLPSWRMLGCLPAASGNHQGHATHDGSGDDAPVTIPAHCCHLAPCDAAWSPARAAGDAPMVSPPVLDRRNVPPIDAPDVSRVRWQPPATAPPRDSVDPH